MTYSGVLEVIVGLCCAEIAQNSEDSVRDILNILSLFQRDCFIEAVERIHFFHLTTPYESDSVASCNIRFLLCGALRSCVDGAYAQHLSIIKP